MLCDLQVATANALTMDINSDALRGEGLLQSGKLQHIAQQFEERCLHLAFVHEARTNGPGHEAIGQLPCNHQWRNTKQAEWRRDLAFD